MFLTIHLIGSEPCFTKEGQHVQSQANLHVSKAGLTQATVSKRSSRTQSMGPNSVNKVHVARCLHCFEKVCSRCLVFKLLHFIIDYSKLFK